MDSIGNAPQNGRFLFGAVDAAVDATGPRIAGRDPAVRQGGGGVGAVGHGKGLKPWGRSAVKGLSFLGLRVLYVWFREPAKARRAGAGNVGAGRSLKFETCNRGMLFSALSDVTRCRGDRV